MDGSKCYGCFSDIGVADTCPHCGFNKIEYEPQIYALPLGFTLAGRYVIGKELGSGGFGITYLAYDEVLEIPVAIKEYLPKSLAIRNLETTTVQAQSRDTRDQFEHHMEKFIHEARTIARFNNEPGIVSVQDVIETNGTVYIVMFYVNGITLEQYVHEHGGKLEWHQVMKIMSTVIRSLAHVHKSDLIHRDISPDNIYITKDNKIKLLDFGAARYVVTDASQSLSIILKPGFAPVEQYSSKGKQGPWTDVYAVSSTIYWMLSGIKPQNAMDRMLEDEVKTLQELDVGVPVYVPETLRRGMALHVKDRIQSMDELLMLLEGSDDATVLLGESPSYSKSSDKNKSIKDKLLLLVSNRRFVIPAAVIAMIIVFGGIVILANLANENRQDVATNLTGEVNVSSTESEDVDSEGEADDKADTSDRSQDAEVDKQVEKHVTEEETADEVQEEAVIIEADEGSSEQSVKNSDNQPIGETESDDSEVIVNNSSGEEDSSTEAQVIVEFPDPVLEAKIRELSGVTRDTIYQSDIDDIWELDISNMEGRNEPVRNLEGIQYMRALGSLHAGGNEISALDPLSGMYWLKHIGLEGNPITDYDGLETVTHLISIATSDYVDNDLIEKLGNLKMLEQISFGFNSQKVSIEPLTRLPSLSVLVFGNVDADDFHLLENMTQLRDLTFEQADVDNYDFLRTMTFLNYLEVDNKPPYGEDFSYVGNQTTSVTVPDLAGEGKSNAISSLENLGLNYTLVEEESTEYGVGRVMSNTDANKSVEPGTTIILTVSIGFTGELAVFADAVLEAAVREAAGGLHGDMYEGDLLGITELDLNRKDVYSLEGIEYLSNLERLNMAYTKINDISPILELQKLYWLKIKYTQPSNINLVGELTNLTSLEAFGEPYLNLNSLSNLTNLRFLNLMASSITDLSPISHLTNLEDLFIDHNDIIDLSPLAGMKNLTRLSLFETKVTDISVISSLNRLHMLTLPGYTIMDLSPLSGLTNLEYFEFGDEPHEEQWDYDDLHMIPAQ